LAGRMSAELGCWRYTALRQTGSLSAESDRMPDFQVLIKPGIAAFLDVRWARGFEHAAAEAKTVSSRSARDYTGSARCLGDLEGWSCL